MAHTPTPWIAKNAGVFALAEDRNSEVARCLEGWGFDGAKDNAGFIIEAVNAYDSLKAKAALCGELVEIASFLFTQCKGEGLDVEGGVYETEYIKARIVLAKADAIMPKPAPVEGKVKP